MNVPTTLGIEASAENVLSVLRFVSDCRNTNFTADGIIRALYVETLNNLEFLDNLKLDEANTLEKLGFEKLRAVSDCLSIDISSALVYATDSRSSAWRKAYKELSRADSIKKLESDGEIDGESKSDCNNSEKENLFTNILFVVKKIHLLKSISSKPELKEVFPDFRIKKRLANISKNLLEIQSRMRKLKAVKKLLGEIE